MSNEIPNLTDWEVDVFNKVKASRRYREGTTILYYAHCMAIYGTPQEKRDIDLLESNNFGVYNPNSEFCQNGYSEYGMNFFRPIILACDGLVFRGNPDGSIPAGIAKEVAIAQEHRFILELPCGITRRTMSVEETREYLKESGQR